MRANKKLSKASKNQLSNFFNTLASAWFIAGIITPIFNTTHQFSADIAARGIVSLLAMIVFLNLSIFFANSK